MQALRSDRKINAKIFDIKLLKILQLFVLSTLPQSAHVLRLFSIQQALNLHQDAFSFLMQPGHLLLRNALQAPQYSPHLAISEVSTLIEFIFSPLKNYYLRQH